MTSTGKGESVITVNAQRNDTLLKNLKAGETQSFPESDDLDEKFIKLRLQLKQVCFTLNIIF